MYKRQSHAFVYFCFIPVAKLYVRYVPTIIGNHTGMLTIKSPEVKRVRKESLTASSCLPEGQTMSKDGHINGTIAKDGNYRLLVPVTDKYGCITAAASQECA